eukprot:4766757-Pyramimonas_sp.AAC.1
MSGMPRRAVMLILQPPMETCAMPQANTAIDHLLASAVFSNLVQQVTVLTTRAKRPHRLAQLPLRPEAIKLHQL